MQRLVETSEAVNANVRRVKHIDLDAASQTAEVGKVPAAASPYVVATEYGDSLIHRTVLACTALPISVADDAGVAQYGGVQVYTFPEGLIASLGAIISGNLTMGVTGTFIDAFTGVNALGSAVASTGATLVGTEATWLQSTANATAAAKVAAISSVSIATQLTESGGRVYDGTATAAPMFLNFAIADDASHTAGSGTFTGTITFAWLKVGDK
ncbi:MAG: hypothetical protein IPJ61_18625 [Tessaracoccus sp.]|uniref:hypothetical protein n=1 Tax=Tessaracoccus sp. TaxID=1971211 RepID=UPI001EB28308|nr:hypothetical protein [Tessaracoccus sp.]MBK7823000.1 hypothetical protein [Tessaracoccus sp.]